MGKKRTGNESLNPENFLQKLLTLAQGKMRFLVAYSGGADSTALCLLLSLIKDRMGAQIRVLYINHNLRTINELQTEIALVKKNCASLHLPLRIVTLKPGLVATIARKRRMGTEEAARYLRRAIFLHEKKRTNQDWILTAHHRDDQAETMLMRLFKGSDLQSLGGINEKTKNFLRPLLHCSRQSLKNFLSTQSLDYSTDSTNGDNSNLRSVMRQKFLPVLERVFPNYSRHLDALGATVREYAQENEKRLATFVRITGSQAVFDIRGANERNETFCRAVRACLRAVGGTGQRYQGTFINYLFLQVNEKKKFRLSYKNCLVEFQFPLMTFAPKVANIEKTLYFVDIASPGLTEVKNRVEVRCGTENPEVGSLILSNVCFPLVLRSPYSGDRIKLKGLSKSIKKILQDWKVPTEDRFKVLVLEDRNGIKGLLGGYCGYKDILYYNGEPPDASKELWMKVTRWSERQ